jgi:hypothetical protein
MQALETTITTDWNKLQRFVSLATVQLHPVSSEFEALVKQIGAVFSPVAAQVPQTQSLERLSDGLRSLFYFALVGARFEVEQQMTNNAATPPLLFRPKNEAGRSQPLVSLGPCTQAVSVAFT